MATPNEYIVGQVIVLTDVITDTSALAADIASVSATSVVTILPFGPATGQFTIQVDAEQMLVTSGNASTTLTVTRGVNGTVAATHAKGAIVTAYIDDSTDAVDVYRPGATSAITPAPNVTHAGLATYRASFAPDVQGWWTYVWKSTGIGAGAKKNSLYVSQVP